MTPAQAHELAGDLLRTLQGHIGDPDAIESELLRWLSLIGCPALSQVLLAAVARTFGECMTYPVEFPLDGIAFTGMRTHDQDHR